MSSVRGIIIVIIVIALQGMMRYDARIAMEDELKALGLFRGKEV